MNRGLKRLSLIAIANMYLVLIAGALVTSSGSADGCGESWPLCHGTWLPELQLETVIELSHRLVSGAAGIIVTLMAIWAWRSLPRRPAVQVLAPGAVFFLVVQALLGAAAVMWPQPKAVLALHFGISLISFAAVLLLGVLVFREDLAAAGRTEPPGAGPELTRWLWATLGFSYVVVYLGAYVRHVGAGWACSGWPLCNGQFVPDPGGGVAASYIHRVAAALLTLMVVQVFRLALRHAPDRPDLRLGAQAALVLALLQAASGALMGLGWLNLATRMLHSAVITAFFGSLSYLCLQVLPARWTWPAPARRAAS